MLHIVRLGEEMKVCLETVSPAFDAQVDQTRSQSACVHMFEVRRFSLPGGTFHSWGAASASLEGQDF